MSEVNPMRQVILYQDEDGVWIAEVPSLPGCGSDGATEEEALTNVRDAIQLWIEDAEAHGDLIPEDYPLEVRAVEIA